MHFASFCVFQEKTHLVLPDLIYQCCHGVTFWDSWSRIPNSVLKSHPWIVPHQTTVLTFPKLPQVSDITSLAGAKSQIFENAPEKPGISTESADVLCRLLGRPRRSAG